MDVTIRGRPVIAMYRELKHMLRPILRHILPSPVQSSLVEKRYRKVSFSQCGEDLIIQYAFNLRGISKPSYVDIGANHPFFISNSALFYEQGCRGINIEANPELYEAFQIHRPTDINLNVGISDQEDELAFYIMKDNTLSSFSKEQCDEMILHGKALAEIKKIKLTTLANILPEL